MLPATPPPPARLPFIARTLLAPSRSLPPGDIPDCTATENTFKQGCGARSYGCGRVCWGYFFIQPIFHFHLSSLFSLLSRRHAFSHITSSSTEVSVSQPSALLILYCLLPAWVDSCWSVLLEAAGTLAPNIWRCAGCAHRLDTLSLASQIPSMGKNGGRERILHRKNNWLRGEELH